MFAKLFYRAVVAQLDRVPDYESGGRRFESSRLHQFLRLLRQSGNNYACRPPKSKAYLAQAHRPDCGAGRRNLGHAIHQ